MAPPGLPDCGLVAVPEGSWSHFPTSPGSSPTGWGEESPNGPCRHRRPADPAGRLSPRPHPPGCSTLPSSSAARRWRAAARLPGPAPHRRDRPDGATPDERQVAAGEIMVVAEAAAGMWAGRRRAVRLHRERAWSCRGPAVRTPSSTTSAEPGPRINAVADHQPDRRASQLLRTAAELWRSRPGNWGHRLAAQQAARQPAVVDQAAALILCHRRGARRGVPAERWCSGTRSVDSSRHGVAQPSDPRSHRWPAAVWSDRAGRRSTSCRLLRDIEIQEIASCFPCRGAAPAAQLDPDQHDHRLPAEILAGGPAQPPTRPPRGRPTRAPRSTWRWSPRSGLLTKPGITVWVTPGAHVLIETWPSRPPLPGVRDVTRGARPGTVHWHRHLPRRLTARAPASRTPGRRSSPGQPVTTPGSPRATDRWATIGTIVDVTGAGCVPVLLTIRVLSDRRAAGGSVRPEPGDGVSDRLGGSGWPCSRVRSPPSG